MQITSPTCDHEFTWDDELALALASELTPLLAGMPPAERIAAMAYQIALAAYEAGGRETAAQAELMGQLVAQIVAAGFRAQEKQAARPVLRLVQSVSR